MSKGQVAILLSGLLLLFAGCGRTKMGVRDSERSASPPVRVVETEEGFAFFESQTPSYRGGEEKVLFYQRKPKSLDGKYSRCHYIHPLYSLDGQILLPNDIRFASQGGDVAPIRTPMEEGPWLDFSGDFQEDGEVSGLAILCHRSLPGYPQRWILRRAGSMQNAVYPGQEPVLLSREKPLVLRYRLIVHRGNAQQVELNKLQAQYNAEYH